MSRKIWLACYLMINLTACSRSGHRKSNELINGSTSAENNTVKIEQIDGVYQIPVEINGIPMHFVFDTGASMISISETEAVFLYKQGKLSREDIKGSARFFDASGNISEGTLINLREVKIGNKVLDNIQATVVHNLGAPLLFGQSALQKFGKVSIDYRQMIIEFE
ncbi:MAG: hypothetical protein JWR38_5298 [Mucilaginibacter sp.]|nr:hypothetical protein [Mucilaginibacter sp.]